MKITLDDNDLHLKLAPLSLTRPVAEIRFGIATIAESWCALLNIDSESVSYNTESYLTGKFKSAYGSEELKIAGNIKPNEQLATMVLELEEGETLYVNDRWIASKKGDSKKEVYKNLDELLYIEHCWDIFQKVDQAISSDLDRIRKNNVSQQLSGSNQLLGQDIFVEEGAKVECCILNSTSGPIYIGKNTEIMEGSVIRGPFALCEGSTVKLASKIYGATVIGPHCKVGGEISNSVFQAYSNKGHDGFMGNSVIGEWCNFGADTNTSNLKNNYSNLRIHSFESKKMEQTNLLFCGVLMGDHSKTGINTMLNTATTVGVSANIFGAGFPNKYIPSFSWGGHGEDKFILDKAFEVAENMMKRRKVELTEGDKKILNHLYQN
ncbi:MAG: glucose-1-phosphate thymidylyltransferase [Flavobacteriales bacterium]|nr:glucose-1-phosphate thymidylyltransferase [Flavobacteriales bacterium]